VVLHIGAMKTGTTFLQHVMMANREGLAAAGYPFAATSWPQQVRAVQDVVGLNQQDPRIRANSRGAWRQVSGEMLAQPGVSIMSMEFLSFARPPAIRRIKQSLAGADVHVILTVRDANGTVPAQWQTSVTSGRTHTWTDFQRGVRRAVRPGWQAYVPTDSGVREFRNTQDIPAMLRRWSALVPPSRLHVVTVPIERGDPMELWRRFCRPIGLDPDVAVNPPAADNPSLGFASTELVRRMNLGLEEVRPSDYNRTIKDRLVKDTLSQRRQLEERIVMNEATQRAALRWNARTAAAIESSGVDLVGSLDDLPSSADAPGVKPAVAETEEPDDAAVLVAAQVAARGMRKLVKRRTNKLARQGGDQHPVPDLPDWAKDAHPSDVGRAVDDLVALTHRAVQLRGQLLDLAELSPDA